jgi:hypothetical protein
LEVYGGVRAGAGSSHFDPQPTSDALRRSKHEANEIGPRLIPRLVDLFMAGRMPLDRLIARYDFADFNLVAA